MPTVEKFKYKILSVDDNQNNLFTLNALLSTVGNIVPIEALGAKEALDILLTQHIDLILCDVQMPSINGFELAKLIKSNKKTKDIPIIFVTAVFKSDEFIAQGFKLGAVDYLTKPIDDNQLLNKIALYLKIFEQKNQLIQSEKRFYDIAQSIGDGIYTLNREGRVSFINKEALKLLSFNSKELIGVKIHDYIHYKNIKNKPLLFEDCSVHRCMDDGDIHKSDDEVLIKKDGSFLHVSMVATPLYVDENIVGSVVVFKDKTNQNIINKLKEEKIKNQEQIIYSMIDMIESRDSYTAGHSKRVANYCVLIAKEMRYSQKDIDLIKNAAWLHDIGKISTPDSVLLKPSQLDDIEYGLIKEHLDSGYEMLHQIDQYQVLSDVMREHHERYDGGGYPRGLKGDEIKPLSQIMIVADAFDAMTTNRVYKEKKSISAALEELESLSAIQFHPNVVTAAVVALSNVEVDESISQLPNTLREKQRFTYFYKDKLTSLFVIEYLDLILRYYMTSSSFNLYNVQLNNFSQYNKRFSWKKGDEFLANFAKHLKNLNSNVIVFRIEGDDFAILSENKIDKIKEKIYNFEMFKDSLITLSVKNSFIEDTKDKKEKILDLINK